MATTRTIDSPNPITRKIQRSGDAEAFIPYPDVGTNLEHVPVHIRPDVHYYISRMGFLPYTIRLDLHVPWVAEHMFRMNNAVMRDERNHLSEHFKYRLALICSRDNKCTYCTSHISGILKQRWGYSDDQIFGTLSLTQPKDDAEGAAWAFARQSNIDADAVTDEQRARLASHFTPQQIMEVVFVVGFWKMYNTMHSALGAPLEDPVVAFKDWVKVQPAAGGVLG